VTARDQQALVEADAERTIARFLFHEARLLDAGMFEEWLELFAPDGVYWVPSRPDQTDRKGVASIVYEDRGILAMRVRRLAQGRALVLAPAPRTTHLVSNIEITAADADALTVESALLVAEYRDGERRIFAGRCRHSLVRLAGALRIAEKRVDLIDCDAVLGAITIPL
jgi:benzoate/toluate 1,2-dioxygenase beta subunit